MQAPERTSLSRKTADALEVEIRNGRWSLHLPGYRKLCETLGVSPRTMHTALEILTRRSIILPAERTKPRRAHPAIIKTQNDETGRKSLLILTAQPVQLLNLVSRQILEKVSTLFTRKGWTVNFESTPEYLNGSPGPTLERMLANRGSHRWLLLKPDFKIVHWAMENNIRAICLGGEPEHLNPPLISVNLTKKLTDSVEHMIRLGHKKICSLIHLPSENSRKNVIRSLKSAMSKNGIDFHPSYNLPPILTDDATTLREILKGLFTHSPPTALIVNEVHHLIGVYSFCLEKGLRIPLDLSVILTKEDQNIDWFHPTPAHYQFPISQYVSNVQRYIEHYPTGPSEPIFLKPSFIQGESLAPPK